MSQLRNGVREPELLGTAAEIALAGKEESCFGGSFDCQSLRFQVDEMSYRSRKTCACRDNTRLAPPELLSIVLKSTGSDLSHP